MNNLYHRNVLKTGTSGKNRRLNSQVEQTLYFLTYFNVCFDGPAKTENQIIKAIY